MRTIRRGGEYLRVADPEWDDPLDGSSAQQHGGRWNAPGSFPVVYLNAAVAVARANVYRQLGGQPYGPEDLDPDAAPVLVTTAVADARHVDVVTNRGCTSVDLPVSYPRWPNGVEVGHERCGPIGQAAWDAGMPGIACRSATRAGEELAWFRRSRRRLKPSASRPFDQWFWPDTADQRSPDE